MGARFGESYEIIGDCKQCSRDSLIICAFSRPKQGTIYNCLVYTKILTLKEESKEVTLRIYLTSSHFFIFLNLKWNDLDNHPSCFLLLNLRKPASLIFSFFVNF